MESSVRCAPTARRHCEILGAVSWKKTQFDLIVTDHQMPVMDGVTLVGEIKKNTERTAATFYPDVVLFG